jgi:hypothetical protein
MNVRERGYDSVNWIKLARAGPNGLIDSNGDKLRAFLYCAVNMYLTLLQISLVLDSILSHFSEFCLFNPSFI